MSVSEPFGSHRFVEDRSTLPRPRGRGELTIRPFDHVFIPCPTCLQTPPGVELPIQHLYAELASNERRNEQIIRDVLALALMVPCPCSREGSTNAAAATEAVGFTIRDDSAPTLGSMPKNGAGEKEVAFFSSEQWIAASSHFIPSSMTAPSRAGEAEPINFKYRVTS